MPKHRPLSRRPGFRRAGLAVAAALLLVVSFLAAGTTGAAPRHARTHHAAAPAAARAVSPAAAVCGTDPECRKDKLKLALVSRTFDTDHWVIVADATLDSNRVCLPIAFNCIVDQATAPSNASLTQLQCQSLGWNHLLVFRDHCLKQLGFAGFHQKFRFTCNTNPGVTTGTVNLKVEFGRGFLPDVFEQLATASLAVDLGLPRLDIAKSCPDTVGSGQTLACTVTVTYPVGPGPAGPPITGIAVTDTPDGALAGFVPGGTLGTPVGPGGFGCALLVCSGGTLSPGQSVSFTYGGTVGPTATGGAGVNTAGVAWAGPVAGGAGPVEAPVTVVGTGDTSLVVEKVTSQTTVKPGGTVTWTVTVTNQGPLPGTTVVVTDTPPAAMSGVTMTYASGVGTWACSGLSCTTASMPVGSASFTVTGTVSASATSATPLVNEVGVTWANDIEGPDFPVTAGSAVEVEATATTTTTTATPASTTTTAAGGSTTTTTAFHGGGAPIHFVG